MKELSYRISSKKVQFKNKHTRTEFIVNYNEKKKKYTLELDNPWFATVEYVNITSDRVISLISGYPYDEKPDAIVKDVIEVLKNWFITHRGEK